MTDDIVTRLRSPLAVGEVAECVLLDAADEIERLRAEIERLDAENAEMLDTIIDLVSQSCDRDGELDSMAISTYAGALRLLADKGKVVIKSDAGRRVIGRWAE